MNFSDNRPKMQHNISLSGGIGDVNYFVSGAYEYRKGILKVNPDTYNKYNLRSKIEFPVTKWARFSNNTSLYSTSYKSQGNGSIEDTFGYSAMVHLHVIPTRIRMEHGYTQYLIRVQNGKWPSYYDWRGLTSKS